MPRALGTAVSPRKNSSSCASNWRTAASGASKCRPSTNRPLVGGHRFQSQCQLHPLKTAAADGKRMTWKGIQSSVQGNCNQSERSRRKNSSQVQLGIDHRCWAAFQPDVPDSSLLRNDRPLVRVGQPKPMQQNEPAPTTVNSRTRSRIGSNCHMEMPDTSVRIHPQAVGNPIASPIPNLPTHSRQSGSRRGRTFRTVPFR